MFISESAFSLNGMSYSLGSRSGNRALVPVHPSNYIYARFKHVAGVPAPNGGKGVAINKLKILDTLIERVAQTRKERLLRQENFSMMSDKQLDALIYQFQEQAESIAATSMGTPYTPSLNLSAGTFFSIAA